MTSDAFSKAIGVSRTTLWRYENGAQSIPFNLIVALGLVNVSPSEIMKLVMGGDYDASN
ncbi:hypothetical protein FORC73_3082 [Vibrio cholerae]|nr:hypothetical protein FORC73_3082 [Vibrio cholerae]